MRKFASEAELLQWLAEDDRTDCLAVGRPEEILFDEHGVIRGCYRFSNYALSQLCAYLGAGAFLLISDLAGESRSRPDARCCPRQAIRLLNDLIRFRFSSLSGCRLIVDRKERRVDGCVGSSYRLYPHRQFVERCRRFLGRAGWANVFHEAAAEGRRLQLRYRLADRAFSLDTPLGRKEPFYGGVYFANAEAGEAAAKVSAVLIRRWTGACSMQDPFEFGKAVHIFRGDFDRRLDAMLAALPRGVAKLTSCQERLQRLRGLRIGLETVAGFRRCEKFLLGALTAGKVKLFQHEAEAVIAKALFGGSYRSERVPEDSRLDSAALAAMRRRTWYDVYNALTILGREWSFGRRDVAEQLAYRLMEHPYPISSEERNGENDKDEGAGSCRGQAGVQEGGRCLVADE